MPRPSGRSAGRTQMSRSNIALSNLRAVVIVIVLAFHSVLAYLASLPARRLPLRRGALPLAGHSHRRQPPLVRLRPVLRLAGRQPDVADVLSIRLVRAVEPGAQGKRDVSLRPLFPDRVAAGAGRRVADAADLLSDVSRDRCRSERRRLLAASDGAAVLAMRPAVVPVAAAGAQRAGGGAQSLRARLERKPGPAGGVGAHPSDPFLCRAGCACRRWLTCRSH